MTEIALIGNPNSGKTSLFNLITGTNQRVGNWPGVTVERKVVSPKRIRASKFRICLASIPCPLIVLKKKWRGIIF